MQTTSPPQYIKATITTVLAVAALPAAFLVLALLDYQSPSWDPQGDSGAVQGYMVIFLAASLATGYTAAAFPIAARKLHRTNRLRRGPFLALLSLWLLVTSLVVATAASLLVGGLSLVVPLTFILFVAAAVLSLPFVPLWLWLAQ